MTDGAIFPLRLLVVSANQRRRQTVIFGDFFHERRRKSLDSLIVKW